MTASHPQTSGSPVHILISHSHSNAAIAQCVADAIERSIDLEKSHIRCTSDRDRNISAGQGLPGALLADIHEMKVLVGLFSPESIKSTWVAFELGAALALGRTIIPVLIQGLEQHELPGIIREKVSIKLATDGDTEVLIEEVAKALGRPFLHNAKGTAARRELAECVARNGQKRTAEAPALAGIVPASDLRRTSRLPDEVFAIEVLNRPVTIRRRGNQFDIEIDRGGVAQVIISTEGKRSNCRRQECPDIETLQKRDREIQQFLLNPRGEERVIRGLPLRWASGGVLPIVDWQKPGEQKSRKWVPMFFRDIRPYGWNISLGATERTFNDANTCDPRQWEAELQNPLLSIEREFLEECLILDKRPSKGEYCMFRRYVIGNHQSQERPSGEPKPLNRQFDLRGERDELNFGYAGEGDSIPVTYLPGPDMVTIVSPTGEPLPLKDTVITCFSLMDMGIELVRPVEYTLHSDDYLLDGEVYEKNGNKELTRMPVAMIAREYLARVFGAPNAALPYTLGMQPSVQLPEAIPQQDIYIFPWDLEKRLEIVVNPRLGIHSEPERYTQWYDKFWQYFVGEDGKLSPTPVNASRLFTPATAKILQRYFTSPAK